MSSSQNSLLIESVSIKELLTPLKGIEGGCGRSMTHSESFDSIRHLRRHIQDERIPQGVWKLQDDHQQSRLIKECMALLMYETKDLQVAFWLTEGWLYTEGLAGLLKGINYCISLIRKFPKIFPVNNNEEDKEHILSILTWFDEAIYTAFFLINLSPVSSDSDNGFTLMDYQSALKRKKKPTAHGKRTANEQVFSFEELQRIIIQSPKKNYEELALCMLKIGDSLKQFESVLANHLSLKERFCFTKIANGLKVLTAPINSFIEIAQPAAESASVKKKSSFLDFFNLSQKNPEETTIKDVQETIAANRTTKHQPDKMTRAIAYAELKKIADFLMTAEPQSPTPALLKKIAGWQGKSYAEILAEFSSPQEASAFFTSCFGRSSKA